MKYSEQNIGFLRQWLNEDRITDPKKMISNEDIKHWLKPSEECKCIDRGNGASYYGDCPKHIKEYRISPSKPEEIGFIDLGLELPKENPLPERTLKLFCIIEKAINELTKAHNYDRR